MKNYKQLGAGSTQGFSHSETGNTLSRNEAGGTPQIPLEEFVSKKIYNIEKILTFSNTDINPGLLEVCLILIYKTEKIKTRLDT